MKMSLDIESEASAKDPLFGQLIERWRNKSRIISDDFD